MSALRRFPGRAWRRVKRLVRPEPPPRPQLEMVWGQALDAAPEVRVSEGYALRNFEPGDRERYLALLAAAGMPPCPLDYWESHLLPRGFFVIEHSASRALVATCMASHHPAPRHPYAGNLGWLAADPAHSGHNLGWSATAAVTARLLRGGYERLYLTTDDFRAAAIRIYLRMGWVPLLYTDEVAERWRTVCDALEWPYTPQLWMHHHMSEGID